MDGSGEDTGRRRPRARPRPAWRALAQPRDEMLFERLLVRAQAIERAIEAIVVDQRRRQGEEVLQRGAAIHVSALCSSLDGSLSRASTTTAAIVAHGTASRQ